MRGAVSDAGEANLPHRTEVVARADSLAVAGAKEGGAAGAQLLGRAATLRRRVWRLDHRDTDALEALELYRSMSRMSGKDACHVQLDAALLRAELEVGASKLYVEIEKLRPGLDTADCKTRADEVLRLLHAFRPLPRLGRSESLDAGPDRSLQGELKPQVSDFDKGPAQITRVERYGSEEAARIVVFVSRPVLFEVGYLERVSNERGPRLYVDIRGAKYKGPLSFEVGGLVERTRLGPQKEAMRVVLDLKDDVERRIFYLPEPFRLVIDVAKRGAGTVEAEHQVRRVVLDPGHGGHDPGASGAQGLKEKDVTLDIAHRAAPILARDLGIETLLTRDMDAYVTLDERTARANAFRADLFISIHCNASENGDGDGIMTFVLDRSVDALAAQIAARENAASPAAASELAAVMSHMVDQRSVQQSLRLANLVQRATVASLAPSYPGIHDRGVKRAGFYVLAGARMPAVLFETSFISNPLGEMRLNSADYRQKLADAIVNAVRAYRDGIGSR